MRAAHSSTEAEGLWVSISELAEMKGISRQSMQERVARLERASLVTLRPGAGRSRLVNVAEFDRVAGETVDAVRALNGSGAAPQPLLPSVPGDPVLAREQARRAAYDADLKQLDLEERLGKLLPVAEVRDAMTTCAETMARAIDGISGRADDLAEAVGREGSAGARRLLKTIAQDLRTSLARSMALHADGTADEAA